MKKVIIAILLLAGMSSLWYFFVKPGEFEVSFEAKTLPGNVIQVIKIWNRSLRDGQVTEVDSFQYLRQKIKLDDREYVYEWRFDQSTDSTTGVSISISEKGQSLQNKILVPLGEPPIEKDARRLSYDFFEVLKQHLKITKVKVEGVSELPEQFCVCTGITADQLDKAKGMMSTYDLLVSLMLQDSLVAAGKPIVNVTSWSHNHGTLKFDFCFPIEERDSLPAYRELYYKRVGASKALKAIYNGNYITSDKAWYSLYQYASQNGEEVVGLPIEIFYNNPNLGSNEISWKAEVFLPVR